MGGFGGHWIPSERKSTEQMLVSSSRIGQEGEMNEVHGWIYVSWLICGFLSLSLCRRWERKDRKERGETTPITFFENESCIRIFDRCSREIDVRRCSPYVYALLIAFITLTQANEKNYITNGSYAHSRTHSLPPVLIFPFAFRSKDSQWKWCKQPHCSRVSSPSSKNLLVAHTTNGGGGVDGQCENNDI